MYGDSVSAMNDFYSFPAEPWSLDHETLSGFDQQLLNHEMLSEIDQELSNYKQDGLPAQDTSEFPSSGIQALMPSSPHSGLSSSHHQPTQHPGACPPTNHPYRTLNPLHPPNQRQRATHAYLPSPYTPSTPKQAQDRNQNNTYSCPICTMGDPLPRPRRYMRRHPPTVPASQRPVRADKQLPLPKRAHAYLTPTWFNMHISSHHLGLFRRASTLVSSSTQSTQSTQQQEQEQEFTCLLCPCGTLAGELGCDARFVGKEDLLGHLRGVHAKGRGEGKGRFEHLCGPLGVGG